MKLDCKIKLEEDVVRIEFFQHTRIIDATFATLFFDANRFIEFQEFFDRFQFDVMKPGILNQLIWGIYYGARRWKRVFDFASVQGIKGVDRLVAFEFETRFGNRRVLISKSNIFGGSAFTLKDVEFDKFIERIRHRIKVFEDMEVIEDQQDGTDSSVGPTNR
jgi:hypothetical protein